MRELLHELVRALFCELAGGDDDLREGLAVEAGEVGDGIDAALFEQNIQTQHIRLVRNMAKRIAEDLRRRYYRHYRYQWPCGLPVGTLRLMSAVKVRCEIGIVMQERADRKKVNEGKRLAAKVGGKPEDEMYSGRNQSSSRETGGAHNSRLWPRASGDSSPKCRQMLGVATRPRGVRCR